MSDYDILMVIMVGLSAGISYFVGHKKGISNTVDFLEDQGILEFEE